MTSIITVRRPARRLGSRATAGLVLAGVAAVYAGTANFSARQSFDTIAAALAAWRLANFGDLDLTAFQGWADWIVPVGDTWVSNRFPGPIAWGAPFYALTPSAEPTVAPAALAAVVATTLALTCLYAAVTPVTGGPAAAVSVVALGLGTPLWSVSADALWSHAPAALCLSAAVLARSKARWGLAGLALGAAVLCRPHLLVAGLVLVLLAVVRERRARPALVVLAGLACGVTALVLYNAAVYGTPSILGGYTAAHAQVSGVGPAAFAENLLGAVLSPSRGLAVYSPFLLVLLPWGRAAWREAPPWVRDSALAGLGYALVQLWLIRFTGGSRFYSGRVLIEPLVLAGPLLAVTLRNATSRAGARRVVAIAVAASVLAIGAGAVSNFGLDRELRPWTDFLLVPAAAALTPLQLLALVVLAVGCAVLTWRVAGREGPVRPSSSAIP